MKKTLLVTAALSVAVCAASFASNFRVADTIYLPAAGKLVGGGGTAFFRTDVWIANLSNEAVVVDVAYAPTADASGPRDNRNVTASAVRLPGQALAANERREIIDIMGAVFGFTDAQTSFGHLIFFACRQNGNCAGANPVASDFRNISVEARIYTTEAGTGRTYGQLISGIPWYSYISADSQSVGLNTAFIVGVRQTAEYRTNIGLVNASQFSSTNVRVRLFNSNGTQFGSDFNQALPPLAHIQNAIIGMFPGFSGSGGWVTVEQTNVTPTDPGDPQCGSSSSSPGCPGFLAYGSLLDNRSNDPTYLETQFTQSFEQSQADCIFTAKTPPRRIVRR